MPHCPHVGGGPTHAHCPFVSSPHVWPFVQTGLPEQTVGPHSGSVVVVVVGGHTVQKPPLHPNPVKHVVPPQHGAPLKPQHGFGSHVPAPRLTPPALEQSLAVSKTQAKAPMGDPGTQHWFMGHVPQSCGHVPQSSEFPQSPSPHTQLHGGDPPVQLQRPAWQSEIKESRHALLAFPLSPLAAASSLHVLLPQVGAAFVTEARRPTPSASNGNPMSTFRAAMG
jgi:hypothetical protein